MPCYRHQGIVPAVDPTSYIHPLAAVIGDVIVGPGCYIAPGASLRGDFGRIVVEADVSIQDNCTVHASADCDTVIRRGATIGHGAVVHGAVIGENALIGINAVVLDHAEIGAECLVAALALVKSETVTPPRSLVAGNPAAAVVRTIESHEVTWRNDGNGEYQRLVREVSDGLVEVMPLDAPEPDRPRTRSTAIGVRLRGSVSGRTSSDSSSSGHLLNQEPRGLSEDGEAVLATAS